MSASIQSKLRIANKKTRLMLAKMQVRQKLLLDIFDDVDNDTELQLGAFGEEAERFTEALKLIHEKYQPFIEQFQTWNKDSQEFMTFFEEATQKKDVPPQQLARLIQSVSMLAKNMEELETSTLEEMTETVQVVRNTLAELRREASGEF